MVCPHAAIRTVVLDEKQLKSVTKGMVTKAFNGMDNYKFAIIGCVVCVEVCPGMRGEKALYMDDFEKNESAQKYFDFGAYLPTKNDVRTL